MPQLKARTRPVTQITPQQRDRMFQVFERYYAEISREQFETDLNEKEAVILLIDRKSAEIQGFSTLKTVELTSPCGQNQRAVYSGDTVVEQAYWGQKVLGIEFLKVLFRKKLERPFEPLYWFLISKGYKTYLLMANNFKTHYPRFEQPTPAAEQALLDRFADALFGKKYSRQDGLIRFPVSLGQVRRGVADITERELQSNPRIRFFAVKNPEWKNGTELACLAEMTFSLPFAYAWKRLLKVTLGIELNPFLPMSASSPVASPTGHPALPAMGSTLLKLVLLLKSGGGR